MKKLNILLLSALAAVSGSALAMGGTVEQGKNFTNLNLEMGKSSSGVYLESNWLKN
ncbi:YfaZ family outer membrane protein, partial [Enterobacter hormaechei]